MKIELKHLAPYLPYKLMFIYMENTVYEYFELVHSEPEKLNKCSIRQAINNYYKIKPILRPLSDLTKEIEVNGEKFVPILEFYKIAQKETGEFEHNEYKTAFTPEAIASLAHFLTKDLKHGWQFNYLIPQKSFSLYHSDTRENETICQFALFEKLFEWHFDVFGLIPTGLAIDINTL